MRNAKGFTLIELLVAMAISAIVMTAIVTSYQAQVQAKITQEVSLEMQQGARAALEQISNDIRMAGCDPTRDADSGVLIATGAVLAFSLDIDNDAGTRRADEDLCDANEVIRYRLTNDANNDGIADGTPCHLGREADSDIAPALGCAGDGAVTQEPLAMNIDALNFVYFDSEGNILPAPVDIEDIRSIQVTLVARSGEQLRGFLRKHTDTLVYRNQQGDIILPAQNDDFRRLRLSTTINCRNLGD